MSILGEIIIAVIGLIGVIFSAQIKQGTKLQNFRIEKLEQGVESLTLKVDKTRELENTVLVQAEQIKELKADIEELKGRLSF